MDIIIMVDIPHNEAKSDTRRPSRLPNSTWWKWSQDRRASLARREEQNANKELTIVRVPTPIIKAREESIKFVAPELKDQHLPEEHKRQKPKKKVAKGKKGKKAKGKSPRVVDAEKDLSLEQWNELIEYWDHHAFTYARILALIFTIVSIGLTIFIIVSNYWVTYGTINEYAGIWQRCRIDDSCNMTININYSQGPLHLAVFSLMISTAAIGALGTCVLIYGMCITYLPQKIYYYHSAAEIFIVSAFLELCALIVYPVGISKANITVAYMFNYCYYIGWAGFILLVMAAIGLLFDDILRESSKPRDMTQPWLFWKKKKKRKKISDKSNAAS